MSLALLAVVAAAGGLSSASPAHADGDEKKAYCSTITQKSGTAPQQDTQFSPTPVGGGPLDIMDVAAAAKASSAGAGVDIAVIDSGAEGGANVKGLLPAAQDSHGTVANGLISQIAGKANVKNYPVVFVKKNDGGEGVEVKTDAIATALQMLASGPTKHLVVSVDVGVTEGSQKMAAAVQKLESKGAIVVAPANFTGNPPAKSLDLAGTVFPAAYAGETVVANVSHTTSNDAATSGANTDPAPNSNTTIAAPVYGAGSRTLYGKPCWVDTVDAGYATAEVSAVLAVIWSKYPSLSSHDVIERLYRTASGREGSGGRYTGAGIVQAYRAVTEPLEDVKTKTMPIDKAALGHPPADVLADVRKHAVWWGIGGGGALLLGLIMGPLFRRLRKPTS